MRFYLFFALLCCLCASPAMAEDDGSSPNPDQVFEMDEYVVTGTSTKDQIKNIPRNVNVITAEDIEKSTAQNLPELLGREAGIQLIDDTGVPGRSKVDIRGQGEHAATNVLVLVDGHRINSVDMSGANFTTIPLSQIERIEILRGPGGALYGNNAVGGVINVITKSGEGTPFGGSIGAEFGSYNTKKYQAAIHGSKDIFSMNAIGSYSDSDGYRENGGMEKKDAQFKFGLDPTDIFSMNFSVAVHEEEYGMPGGVNLDDIDDRDKRREKNPWNSDEAHGSIEQQRIQASSTINLEDYGSLDLDLGLLFRDNPYTWGYGTTYKIQEDTYNYALRWDKKIFLYGREHTVQLGLDGLYSDYNSWEEIQTYAKENGLFVATAWSLTDDLTLTIGSRYTHYNLDRKSFENKNWNHISYDSGLIYSLGSLGNVYGSVATGFRTPSVDDMNYAVEDIEPQTTINYEVGTHLKPWESIAFDVAVFRQESKHEIYTIQPDPTVWDWVTDNRDEPILRHGIEASIKYCPIRPFTLRFNYTWIHARFKDSNNVVPLVPEHSVNAGVDWRFIEQACISLDGKYVSSKYDGNDSDNDTYEKIDAYTVVDAKLTWECTQALRLYACVNNIFDELYATTAYGETYYVMPERNFYAGMEWKF
ncbi:TonB-dependent receptor [Desulfoplanes formicivorans]|uniref:TonB-dependent receptor n=1 Tax=Desulfoplanes formicivorans TaxID=1592317 RepID=A0A194AHQ9_9BACT|nr:TonB-dependent receptor [Desulfoplanes formicivorans]GAU08750.1 hypothetical protein DPF_1466 [Desulfoplanes formicivorans]